MPILDALAEVADLKDFRLRQFMADQGMDPTQPSQFYRALIREARQLADQSIILDDLRAELASLKAELSNARTKEVETTRSSQRAVQRQAQQDAWLKQRAAALEERLQSAEEELSEVWDDRDRLNGLMQGLERFLTGDDNSSALKKVFDLVADAHSRAMRRELAFTISGGRVRPQPDAWETARLRELRTQLGNLLRRCLALTPEQFMFAYFYDGVWKTECVNCGQKGALPDQRIVWRHVGCVPRKPAARP